MSFLLSNFSGVDGQQILTKLKGLPITQWNYKSEKVRTKHIGPIAQDLYAAFWLGSDTVSISTIDPSGGALAAIKELIKQHEELKSRVDQLSAEVAALKKK